MMISEQNTDNSLDMIESVIEFSTDTLINKNSNQLGDIGAYLKKIRADKKTSVRIRTSSPLLLLLIPLIIPLKNRITIELEFKNESLTSSSLEGNEISRIRKFKEILQVGNTISECGIDVVYSKQILS
jgi:hypothetical protein